MPDTKPTTAWSTASLVCGILGLLGAIPLPFIDYQHIAGATAGVGIIVPLFLGLVSALFALVALILGLVALARTRDGRFGGRGKAWSGVALGSVLMVAYLAVGWLMYAGG
jgi:hypothetical protein